MASWAGSNAHTVGAWTQLMSWKKQEEQKSCSLSGNLAEKFYENIDPTFLFVVTAGKSRDLIMHVDCLRCI
jgi:hypothetical protein